MHSTAEARHEYVSGMFFRVETNSTLAAHASVAILEMVIELRLHGWPFHVIGRAIRARAEKCLEGTYDVVRDIINDALCDYGWTHSS